MIVVPHLGHPIPQTSVFHAREWRNGRRNRRGYSGF
jgi:hypothetical protein